MKQTQITLLVIALFTGIVTAQDQAANYHFEFKKGQYQLMNPEGKKIKVEPFTFASEFSEGLALVEKDLQFGFIDSTGQVVIDCQFYDAGNFHEGLAYAAKNGKYGYINKKGDFVFKPQFQMAREFRGDYAKVLKENPDTVKFGSSYHVYAIINKEGNILANQYFSGIVQNSGDDYYTAYIKDSVFHVAFDGTMEFYEIKEAIETLDINSGDMPRYPGGENELRKYIATSVRYPISAQENGLQARCFISFIVDTKGNVTEVYPAQLTYPIILKEGVRVVKNMPRWKPGTQNNKPVKVSYTVPINFVLQ